jgi:hypothetical protein
MTRARLALVAGAPAAGLASRELWTRLLSLPEVGKTPFLWRMGRTVLFLGSCFPHEEGTLPVWTGISSPVSHQIRQVSEAPFAQLASCVP